MRPSSKLYGVLRADQSKDVTRESKHYLNARIVVPSPLGDGSGIELRIDMDERGNFVVSRRDESGHYHIFLESNISDTPPVTWEECQKAGVPYHRSNDPGNTSSKHLYEILTRDDET